MSSIDFAKKQITCRVVYYGPFGSGKTTNLVYLHDKTAPSPATPSGDESGQHYDYLPMSLGEIRGFTTRLDIFTVPGAPGQGAARRELLRGVDGLIFVADSSRLMLEANKDSLAEMIAHLAEVGFSLPAMPRTLQLNKRDLSAAVPVAELTQHLALSSADGTAVEAVATHGVGVFDALKAVTKQVLTALKKGG
ncbi:MAG: gliding-motility protein MglA [Myxococcota bacterium]